MTLDEKRHISQWRTPTFIIKRTIEALLNVTKSFSLQVPNIQLSRSSSRGITGSQRNNLWQEITEGVNSHYILSENLAKSYLDFPIKSNTAMQGKVKGHRRRHQCVVPNWYWACFSLWRCSRSDQWHHTQLWSFSPADELKGTNQIRLWVERKESESPHDLTALWVQIFWDFESFGNNILKVPNYRIN